MKRFFTLSVLIVAATISYAQYSLIPISHYQKSNGDMAVKPECSFSSNAKTDVINEDFSSWPPASWTIINGTESVGTQRWHSEGSGDTYAAILYDNGDGVIRNQDEWLISPEVTIPVNAFLKFDYNSNPYWMVDPNDNADFNVKISTDGGTTWTNIWNENTAEFEYSEWTEAYINLDAYEGQSAKIAFQYIGIDACWFYIDNVRVYGLPEFDLEITDARINFFEIYDYVEDPSDFHYSSHLQKIPIEILTDNQYAYLSFNAIVQNKGYGSGVAQCNVVVTNPNGVEIYNMTSTNDVVIGEMGIDTIDVAYEEGSEFLLENPIVGTYTVIYTIFMEGQEGIIDPHYIPGNNKEILTKTLNFEVTVSTYARDNNNVDDFVGPQYWVGGGNDGDILTVKYPFFANSLVTAVSTYIHPDTDPGNSLLCNIYMYDASVSDYVAIATSPLRMIDEGDLGQWITFEFPDPAYITVDPEYPMTSILVGFEFYYTEAESYLWLGCDKTVPSNYTGTLWYMTGGDNADQWYGITNFEGVPMIRLNLYSEVNVPLTDTKSDINIYPNPASDVLILGPVSDGRVEISDNLGRCIDTFTISDDETVIDINEYKNGNYFLKYIPSNGDSIQVKRFSVVK
jgi:hypothetical protein